MVCSNPKLLLSPAAQAALAKLRRCLDSPVIEVVRLIDQHSCALEQEALLIAKFGLPAGGSQSIL